MSTALFSFQSQFAPKKPTPKIEPHDRRSWRRSRHVFKWRETVVEAASPNQCAFYAYTKRRGGTIPHFAK